MTKDRWADLLGRIGIRMLHASVTLCIIIWAEGLSNLRGWSETFSERLPWGLLAANLAFSIGFIPCFLTQHTRVRAHERQVLIGGTTWWLPLCFWYWLPWPL